MAWISRLYRGDIDADIIGRRRWWYAFSGVVLLICIGSMIFRGFSFGIDFKGGASFQFPTTTGTVTQARDLLGANGVSATDSVVQELSTSSGRQIRIQTPTLSDTQTNQVQAAIVRQFHDKPNDIDISTVGASWGSTITHKALQGLIVFLVGVVLYLSVRYEWKMAAAAMVALVHDLIVTAGVYSLVGFQVTPSTVIALLTILGFSLYDTVVVFDKVRENTATIGTTARRTYAEAANDALNQTIMRSINTSLIALIPVASLLFVGAGLLGAGTLEDLALAQFVGLASGAYSSIFVATPLLVDLKNREPRIAQLTDRVAKQRAAAARERDRAARAAASAGPRRPPAAGGPGDPLEKPADDLGEPSEDPHHGDQRYAATGSRSGGGARPRQAGSAGRRTPQQRGGRGGRPGKRRR